jgi:hypothetical protein
MARIYCLPRQIISSSRWRRPSVRMLGMIATVLTASMARRNMTSNSA